MKKIFSIVFLFLFAFPFSGEAHKITKEQRADAILQLYDIINKRQWQITTERVVNGFETFDQLDKSRNFLFVSDSMQVFQFDMSGARVRHRDRECGPNCWHGNKWHDPKYLSLKDPGYYTGKRKILSLDMHANKKGSVVTVTLKTQGEMIGHTIITKLYIDPITLRVNYNNYDAGRKGPDIQGFIRPIDPDNFVQHPFTHECEG